MPLGMTTGRYNIAPTQPIPVIRRIAVYKTSPHEGRTLRILTLIEEYTRECPAIKVDTSLGGLRVGRVLDGIASERGLPEAIVLDNGPEFRGRALAAWCRTRGAARVHSTRQGGTERLCREFQRPFAP